MFFTIKIYISFNQIKKAYLLRPKEFKRAKIAINDLISKDSIKLLTLYSKYPQMNVKEILISIKKEINIDDSKIKELLKIKKKVFKTEDNSKFICAGLLYGVIPDDDILDLFDITITTFKKYAKKISDNI